MTFDDYWTQVNNVGILPNMAIEQIPDSLSDSTKRRMMKRPPDVIAKALTECIDEINHGSIETVEALLKKKIDNK